jgi:hypothetical protein
MAAAISAAERSLGVLIQFSIGCKKPTAIESSTEMEKRSAD